MTDNPRSIGRYKVVDVLGRGAMGKIFKAHDPDIDRLVAIKLIGTDLLDGADRADFIARFRREAQAAGRCSHPNIVAIHDFALHEGNPFLVMEFIDGANLAQAFPASGRFAVEDAIFVILQVLRALQAAHAMGIVHRDIKPANIMLTGGSLVKVTDFGISRLDTSTLTHVDSVIGSPSYMSPEQCRGETVDGRSDLFSVGIVLYEMLAGRKPFAGRNPAEVFTKLLHAPPPDLRESVPEMPEGLRTVIERSLAKAAGDRFASAEAMAEALQTAAAAHGAAYADRTIIVPARPREAEAPVSARTATGGFDTELLDTLTRKLAEIMGPIATYLVRSAVRKADTVEALCASLAANIEQPQARDVFVSEMRRQISRNAGSTAQHTATSADMPASIEWPPHELERLRVALARHVGPVARVLIKRATASTTSLPMLWQEVAVHIDDEGARAAFLREERSKQA